MKWFLFVVLVVLVKVSNSAGIGYRENDADGVCKMKNVAKKVGCYKDGKGDVGGTRPLTEELVNIRDPTNPAYVKDLALNWSDWKGSLNGLLCECAKRAQAKGYRYIGLQFYGECWSGPNSKNYAKDKEASTCIQEYFTECDVDDTEHPCTGAAWTNYVYSVKGVGKSGNKSKSGSGSKSVSKNKSGSGSNSGSKSKSGSESESGKKSGSLKSGNKYARTKTTKRGRRETKRAEAKQKRQRFRK